MSTFSTPIHPSEKRRPKYGNRKTVVDGITFDSAKEARRWGELRLLEKAREIDSLTRQPRYRIMVGGIKVCDYVGDFRYYSHRPENNGLTELVVEDVKGMKTAVYRLKKKLMLACHGIEIREV